MLVVILKKYYVFWMHYKLMNYVLVIALLVVKHYNVEWRFIMSIEQLKQAIPDFAKDIRLNVSNLFGNHSAIRLN